MKRICLVIGIVLTVVLLGVSFAPAQDAHTCGVCGRTIRGSYFETGGSFYHPGCFTCEYCKQPIKDSYTIFRHRNYHTECFEKHVALRCAVCDGIIEGSYLLDYWGNAYHTRHKDNVLQCDFCQRFIVGSLGNGMKRFPDGRNLCARCAPTAVTGVREARAIFVDAAKKLHGYGIDVDPKPIEIRLVGQEELRRISGARSHDTKGFTDYQIEKNGFGKVKSERVRVDVLNGMPRTQMFCTAAHELMHIWQFQNGRLDQDPALSEGSCNFASYLVLRRIGGAEAGYSIDSMLKDPDPVYGEGFRRVKARVEKDGVAAWLRLLKCKDASLSKR